MRPLEALVGTTKMPAVRTADTRRESNGGFDALFADATARVQHRPPPPNERPGRIRESEPQNSEQPEAYGEGVYTPDDEAYALYYAHEAAPIQSDEPDTYALETAEVTYAPVIHASAEEIIQTAAEILQKPVYETQVLINQTDINVYELAQPEVMLKLLQEVYQAQEPADLLIEPEFPAVYKALGEAMTQLATKEPTVQAQAPAEIAEPSAQPKASVPVVEGLQYAVVDGEVTVSNYGIEPVEAVQTDTVTHTPTRPQTTTAQPTAEQTDTIIEAPLVQAPLVDASVAVAADAYTVRTDAVQAAQQTAQAAQAEQTSPADIINQIVAQLPHSTGEQITEMRLTLRPESLGDILLRVLTQNGIVTAQFVAENQRVREAIEANFNQLRDALTEQGIQFGELSVSVRQNAEEQQRQFAQGRASARHRADSVTQLEESAPLDSIDFDSTINLTA
jgi:flagellar hook-length control protein FliK